MALSRPEFAYLYYPTTQFAKPPYELSPALVWYRLGELQQPWPGPRAAPLRREAAPCHVSGRITPARPTPLVQGENRIWHGCVLQARDAAGREVSLSLFGPILEREGRFKLLSYANGL
jgi:hypothetical protein